MNRRLVVGLAGNPNAGKTTVFNALTGARQHVGNYPGVTVEKKEGLARHNGREILVVDLPGTYSLTAYSPEELAARDFVLREKPDVIVDVVDASNLERNLYLTTQFLELGQPTVVALNMMDVAEGEGRRIDHELLGQLLGVPVVPMAAARNQGLEELLEAVIAAAETQQGPGARLSYGAELDEHVQELADRVAATCNLPDMSPRWVAVKLLEGDPQVRTLVSEASQDAQELLAQAERARAHIRQVFGDDPDIAIADRRYGFISGAVREAMHHDQLQRIDWSDAVDRFVVSRILGLPVFIFFMWAMFELVFRLGAPPMEWLASGVVLLQDWAKSVIPAGDLQSLVVNGIIGGVGGVLTFVPNIVLLFVAISILEDSGYMARAAFVVDRVMHHVGLHGKSFIPMLIGFGCTVPAIMAARTLDQRRDRIVTILVTPLMSCGARLPIYVLLAGAFFAPDVAGKVIFSVYLVGVVLAVLMAYLFRSYLLTGPTTPFVMELPPYRMPTLRGVAIHVWERTYCYVRKAGTVILAFSVIMWFLMSFPSPPPERLAGLSDADARAAALEYSLAGRAGKLLEPALRPLGFDWRMGVALVAGFGAKEVIVSTLSTAYSLESTEEDSEQLRSALRADPAWTPLVAYGFMLFVLIYVPCLNTLAVTWRELGSWKWPAFQAAYTVGLAWVVAFLARHVGLVLGYR